MTLKRGLASLVILAFAAACASTHDRGGESPHALPPISQEMIRRVLEETQGSHVRSVPVGEIVTAGIAGLVGAAPDIKLKSEATQLTISGIDSQIFTLALPVDNSSRAWSGTAIAAINESRRRSAALRGLSTDQTYRLFFDAALKRLDNYTRYLDPAQASDNQAQRDGFGGIGVTVEAEQTSGEFIIASVTADTPASQAGLKVADRIISIAGAPTRGLTLRDVVQRVRGAIGTSVALEIRRPGEEPIIAVNLTRTLIVPPSVLYRRDGDIAHLRVTTFNRGTTTSLIAALHQARREIGPGAAGMILDLRGNLGGILEQARTVSDLFLASGTITSTRARPPAPFDSIRAQPGDAGEAWPMVVLVNGNSASASEIVAAALQDNHRAVVIGTTSFGKGSIQRIVPLPNGGELWLTSARFHSPSGYALSDLGVLPHVCTSGGGTVDAALARIRNNAEADAALARRWRAVDVDDLAARGELRRACLPEPVERDVEMGIAKALLHDSALRAAVLGEPPRQAAEDAARGNRT